MALIYIPILLLTHLLSSSSTYQQSIHSIKTPQMSASSHPQAQVRRAASRLTMDGCGSSASQNMPEVKCYHGLKANIDVCKRGTNVGKVFLGCPLWKTNPCGFFSWVDNGNATSSVDGSSNEEKGNRPSGGEIEKLEAKLLRVKVKKQRLAAENGTMKNQLQQLLIDRDVLKERERVVSRVLYLSWMFFIFVLLGFVSKNFI